MVKQYVKLLAPLFSRQEVRRGKGILPVFLILFFLMGLSVSWGQTTTRFNDGYLSTFKVTNTAAIANTGTAIVVEEYVNTGTQASPNFSVALPSSSSVLGANDIVVAGTSTNAGSMSRSENGRYLIIPGYKALLGAANSSFTTNGAIRAVNGAGTVGAGLNAGGTQWLSGNNGLRSATSDDGTNYWIVGGTIGVQTSINGTTMTTVSTTNTNMRTINIFNGQLYYSAGAGTQGIYKVGTGKPITTGTTSTLLFAPTSVGDNQFSISPDGLTIYYVSDAVTQGVYRSTFNGSAWTGGTLIFAGAGYTGLAVDWSGYSFSTSTANGAKIYACNPTTLIAAIDNGTATVATPTTLRTLTGNNLFRSIAFSPIKQTVSKGASTPVAGNITQGTNNAVLFQFNLAANEGNSTIKKVIVNQGGTANIGSGNSISNFRLYSDPNGDGNIADGSLLSTASVSGLDIIFGSISQTYINEGSNNNYVVIGDISGGGTGTFIPSIVANRTINTISHTTNLVNAGGSAVTIGATPPTGDTLTIVAGSVPNLVISIPGSPSTFTSVCTNSGTSSVTYRITNSGTVAADGVQVLLSGTNPSDYAISGFTQNSTIAPSATADFTVTFNPSADGTRTASADVTSTTSGSNSPSTGLSGIGIASVTQTATTNTPTPVAGTTATLKGTYVLGVCPSSTVMGFVYSISSVDSDPNIGDGPNVIETSATAAAGAFSLPVTSLTAGTQYTYKAYIYDGTTYSYGDPIEFTTSPANDACASATGLTVGVVKVGETFTSSNPTSGLGASKDVWYTFTPTCSGSHTISVTFEEGPDLNFEVYPAPTCPTNLSGRLELFSNDLGNTFIANTNNSNDETADLLNAAAGTTYYIRVIGSNNAGSFDISVTTIAEPSLTLANTGSPSTGSIAAGANNVVLFGFALTPSDCTSSFTFTDVSIATSGDATPSDLSNFRLIADTGNFGVADAGEYATPVGSATFTTGNDLVFSFTAQTLTAGTANRYLLVADVNSLAGNAKTFTATGTVITSSPATTDSVSGFEQSITATSITIADNLPQVTSGNILRGTNTTVVSKAKLTAAGGNPSITQINFVTGGSYVQADIAANGFRLWRTASSSVFDTDTPIAAVSSATGNGETLSFTTSENLVSGDYYYWLTVDIENTATPGHTISVNGLSNTSITSAGTFISGSTTAAGAKTIVAPNLSAGTLAAFGNVCINTTSGANTFTLSGANLDGTDVTIGPLSGFTFDAGSGYGATATISGYGTSISSTNINVKFVPTLAQPYGGTGVNGIPVSGGNASTVHVDASGTGINTVAAVTSGSATSLNNTIATLNGNVTTLAICPSPTTQKGFVYSVTATNSDPIDGGTGVTTTSVSGLATGAYLLNLTGLNAATGYTFKAYLYDGTTYTYGAATTFTTLTPADHLAFVSVPSTGSAASNLTAFTVEARRPDNSVDNTYTTNIVITKATGSGTLSGTTTKAAVAGVATFNDLQLSAADNYTLHADSGALLQITSGTIAIGQTASATWLLTANANATTVGNVTGGAQTPGSGIGSTSYTTNGVSSNGWGTTGLDANDYYQFTISPTAGNDLVVSSISTTNNLSSTTATGEVYYSFNSSFTSPVSAGAPFAVSATAATTTFSGLSISVPNTQTLYVRVFIYKAGANTIGSGQTVRCRNVIITGSTTAAILAPTVTTTSVSAITTTGASSGGNVTSDGGGLISDRGVAYGTSAAPTTGTSNGTGTGTFTSTLSGLSVNTRYFYRAYATNTTATSYGSESNFYTLANVPADPVVNNPTYTSLEVTINSSSENGNPSNTEYAIQETSTSKYVQSNGTLDTNAVWHTAGVWLTTIVSPLASSTTYTFHLKARNGDNVETGFGNSISGTTDTPITPTLSAGTLSAFGNVCINTTTGANSFTLSGTNLDGSDVTIGPLSGFTFDAGSGYGTTATISAYGTTISRTINVKFAPTLEQPYGGTGVNGIPISGGSAASINVDASGSGVNTAPTVTTGSSSGVTTVAATLAGNITDAGCSAMSSYGIEYSTNIGFANGTGTPVTGTGYTTGAFTASVSGLSPNTTYYYHAFATNNGGTSYGSQSSFLTLGLDAPSVADATSITSNSFVANWSSVPGATSYRLDVSTSPTFGTTGNATDLFFSEYVEGSGNNKYIEIYNGTGVPVNLADYRLRLYSGGVSSPSSDVVLAGTLASGSTIVYKNGSAVAYGGASTTNAAVNFTGDDAVALYKISTASNVDIFGTIGEDPGTTWSVGGITTENKTLVRKPNVSGGITVNPGNGFPALGTEWIMSNVDTVSNLGSHTFTSTFVPSFVAGYNDLEVSSTSQSVTGLAANTAYHYRVRAFAASSLSANSNVIDVTTLFNPSVTITGATSKCASDPAVTWTANPGTGGVAPYTYSWNTTPVQTGITATISTAGTYIVTITDSNNVTATDSRSLTVNPTPATPTISAGGPTIFCSSGNVVLTSSAGSSYLWSTGDTTADITVNTSGNYTVQVTNSFGCQSASSLATVVTVTSQPTWYLDADGDHYYTGTGMVQCGTPGPGFTTSGILGGGDCNDGNEDIHPNAPEVCWNNIDDDCDSPIAILSEGCTPVVVNMTQSYHNTTLASLSTAVPAVAYTYPGTTNLKYRYSITNVTTNTTAPDIIQTSRYVTIPASIHLYGATYTIKVSAVINDEVVPFAGNTITVTGPTVQLITLSSVSCGATLASLTTTIAANAGLNATGYTFRIRLNDGSTTAEAGPFAYSQSGTRYASANSFAGFPLQYSKSYKVSVQYTFTDPVTTLPVQSGYGSECTINTPAIPVTSIASPTEGFQVAGLNSGVTATSASYATAYQFRIRLKSDNGLNPSYRYTAEVPSRFSSLTAFGTPSLAYNTEYVISVRYSVAAPGGPAWSEYGPDRTFKTPFFPVTNLVTSQCGLSGPTSLTQQLNIVPYPGYPHYMVLLEEVNGEVVLNSQEIEVSYSHFTLSQFSIAQIGKTYSVSVAIILNGNQGPYETSCDVNTLPGKTTTIEGPFKATAYPNPFANNFMLDVKTTSQSSVNVKVYDMVGRLIEQRDVRVSDMETATIGDRYPSGVYNVVVSQEENVQTVRVVKR